ncbi:hypothetical protein BUALT_Bualt14G0052900 [Buddleja alternifolia]|uniref:Cation/H+ exchanger transmembrane domain-containing protein n=1 Tax=Buddleja alternifolia TaxID=168488 RepID=A0AAV6WPQ5_9LAMI|nr:hypothetical protein BUALT_Bualt14G0052900 [Buddleja alternifolia]
MVMNRKEQKEHKTEGYFETAGRRGTSEIGQLQNQYWDSQKFLKLSDQWRAQRQPEKVDKSFGTNPQNMASVARHDVVAKASVLMTLTVEASNLTPYVAQDIELSSALVETVAQFGVVFLLFSLGLEFSLSKVLKFLIERNSTNVLHGQVTIGTLIFQTNELYQLAAVAFCLMSAWCSDKLGLSLELGSFAAGVMISTTEFSQHTLDQSIHNDLK